MSDVSPEQSPEDRETEYLRNAQEAMREAAQPVIAELGDLAVKDAEGLTAADAQAPDIADEAARYIELRDSSVTAEAKRTLAMHEAFKAVERNAADLKYPNFKDQA